MGRSLTTNEESRWATPLSFLALSSSACWRRRRRASFFTYRCWRFQSSVWGRGTSLLDALKAQKNLWVFVSNRCFLVTFFSWEFFQGFYLLRLVWSSRFKLDYNVQFELVFFFLCFFSGGERWEDYRKMSSLETIVHFCSSGGTLRFVQPPSLSFPRMFFLFCREPIGMLLKQ